jgi:hypothetical protein
MHDMCALLVHYQTDRIQGALMENFKIVGYLVTYRLFVDGLTHIDRFNTLDSAEDFVDTSELAEYVINPIVDLSGD